MSEKNFEGAANKAGIGGGEALGRRLRLLGPAAGTASTLSHTRNRAGAKNLRPNPQISPNLHLKCPFPLLLPPAILCPPFLKRFALGLLRVSMSPVLIWSPTKKRMSLKTRAAFGFELLLGRPSGPRGPLGSALKFWLRSFKLLGYKLRSVLSLLSAFIRGSKRGFQAF